MRKKDGNEELRKEKKERICYYDWERVKVVEKLWREIL